MIVDPNEPLAIQQAKREWNALHLKLKMQPEFKAWLELNAFLEKYRELESAATAMIRSKRAIEPRLMPFLESVLREAGAPVSTKTLHERATNAAIDVGGNEPLRNLSARLSQNPAFKSTPDGWVLTEQPEEFKGI